MGIFIRDRDLAMLDDLAGKIEVMRRERHWSILQLASGARINEATVKKFIYSGRGTTLSFLRLIDAADYDFILVKRTKKKKFWEILGAEEQLYKLKKTQNNAKQRERSEIQSKREEFDRAEHERDFLNNEEENSEPTQDDLPGTIRGGHEIPRSIFPGGD